MFYLSNMIILDNKSPALLHSNLNRDLGKLVFLKIYDETNVTNNVKIYKLIILFILCTSRFPTQAASDLIKVLPLLLKRWFYCVHINMI